MQPLPSLCPTSSPKSHSTFEVSHLVDELLIRSLEDVVRAGLLVRGDEIGLVDRRQRHEVAHVLVELLLQIPVQDLG